MDRTALAICAGILCPLGAVANLGCNARYASPESTAQSVETPPLQLPLNDAASWKQLETILVEPSPRPAGASRRSDADEDQMVDEPAELPLAAPTVEPQSTGSAGKERELAEKNERFAAATPVKPAKQSPREAQTVMDSDESMAPGELNPERIELPWAHAGPSTPEMMAVTARAEQRVRHGFQLANRGALYSARAEFVAALQLVAQANDAQQDTQLYGKALAAGLLAMKESADFVRQNTAHPNIDVARIIARHKTPILKDAKPGRLTPIVAARSYYSYAQEQLAGAAAQDPAGSMALYGLGKIAVTSASANKTRQLEFTAQAMSLCQAALMADPKNFRAANDLAVLFAENGNVPKARELLIHSVKLSSQTATWQNLSAVHSKLGEQQLAESARQKALAMPQAQDPLSTKVEWLDPDTFARTASPTDGLVPTPAAAPKPEQVQTEPAEPKNTARKGIADWLKSPWR